MRLNSLVIVILFLFTLIGSINGYSYILKNYEFIPAWLYGLTGVYILFLYIGLSKIFIRYSLCGINIKFYYVIALVCFIECCYVLLKYEGYSFAKGNFDNPAGLAACLSAGLPFLIYFVKERNKYLKYSAIVVIIVLISVVVVSGSRAGILSILTIGILLTIYEKIYRKFEKEWLVVGCLLMILVLVGLYYIKKDSADGRLLIWRCTGEMIRDKPWCGHGYGAFQAKYMLYQAKYFIENPESKYQLLAGNIGHPYNEFLLLISNYGLLSFGLIFILGIGIIYMYIRKRDWLGFIAISSFISIIIFACFSYPFIYPFVWIIMIFDICVLVERLILGRTIKYLVIVLWCISVLLGGYKMLNILKGLEYKYRWSLLEQKNLEKDKLHKYQELSKYLGDDPSFLYAWAMEYYIRKKWSLCIHIMKKCEKKVNDSEIQLIIGNCYFNLKEYKHAEQCYLLASHMCPKLFRPLYLLVKLYEEQEEIEKARKYALLILKKPVIINSSIIEKIKEDMGRYLPFPGN